MAKTPHQVIEEADEAFNRGMVDAVLSYYEDNAVWVVKPGKTIFGKTAFRKEFEEIFRTQPQVKAEKTHIIECGDIALCTIKWSLAGSALGGTSMQAEGVASTILRRQKDGQWLIVIDNPWGPAILESGGLSP